MIWSVSATCRCSASGDRLRFRRSTPPLRKARTRFRRFPRCRHWQRATNLSSRCPQSLQSLQCLQCLQCRQFLTTPHLPHRRLRQRIILRRRIRRIRRLPLQCCLSHLHLWEALLSLLSNNSNSSSRFSPVINMNCEFVFSAAFCCAKSQFECSQLLTRPQSCLSVARLTNVLFFSTGSAPQRSLSQRNRLVHCNTRRMASSRRAAHGDPPRLADTDALSAR